MMGGVWFVEFPLSQYNENAIEIAGNRGLTLVDSKFQSSNLQMANAPILTKKETKPFKKDKTEDGI